MENTIQPSPDMPTGTARPASAATAARVSPRYAGVSADMSSYREGYKNLVRIIFLKLLSPSS